MPERQWPMMNTGSFLIFWAWMGTAKISASSSVSGVSSRDAPSMYKSWGILSFVTENRFCTSSRTQLSSRQSIR